MEASDFESRRKRSVRWDFRNVDAVCRPCHRKWTESPHKYVEFKQDQLGQEGYDELILDANTIKKWTADEKKQLRKDLREELQRLEEG